MLKCPYYGLWKVYILVLGVPNNRLTCMQGQKILSFICILLCSMTPKRFIFTKPLLCMTLVCGDWSDGRFHFHFIMPVMLCLQRYRGNSYFNAPKAAPSGKEWISIFIQTNAKSNFPRSALNKWAGNMLMFHVDVNLNLLGICFKNHSFQWFRLFLLRDNNFIHSALSDWKLCRMFSFTKSCYTLHNRGTLLYTKSKDTASVSPIDY